MTMKKQGESDELYFLVIDGLLVEPTRLTMDFDTSDGMVQHQQFVY